MKLWIDDLRPAPEGWYWAKDSFDAISTLKSNVVKEISFDHDLGDGLTSRSVVLFLCENESLWPEICHVHSMNPVGAEWLTGMIERYGPGVT